MFWPMLLDILNIENTNFMPPPLAEVVRKLLEIRDSTFRDAEQRENDMYQAWPDDTTDHETQFYPSFKIIRYMKKYMVSLFLSIFI